MSLTRKRGLPPVADYSTRVLILGSMPGEESLRLGEYYGHPRNQFWTILSTVLKKDLVGLSYSDRCRALLKARIGLWDVIASCVRDGSLDTSIRESTVNPFDSLKARCPDLQLVAFNGQKAAKVANGRLSPAVILPSSSAAYCAMPFQTKVAHWNSAVAHLVDA